MESATPEIQNDRAWARKLLFGGWALLVFRIVLGGIFLFASVGKLAGPHAFAGSIGGFKLLHDSILLEVALIVLWLEIICAVLLLAGVWARASATILAAMLVVFFLAIASAMIRGLDIDCGCFGALLKSGVGWPALIRVAVLLALALALIRNGPGRLSLTAEVGDPHPLHEPR